MDTGNHRRFCHVEMQKQQAKTTAELCRKNYTKRTHILISKLSNTCFKGKSPLWIMIGFTHPLKTYSPKTSVDISLMLKEYNYFNFFQKQQQNQNSWIIRLTCCHQTILLIHSFCSSFKEAWKRREQKNEECHMHLLELLDKVSSIWRKKISLRKHLR